MLSVFRKMVVYFLLVSILINPLGVLAQKNNNTFEIEGIKGWILIDNDELKKVETSENGKKVTVTFFKKKNELKIEEPGKAVQWIDLNEISSKIALPRKTLDSAPTASLVSYQNNSNQSNIPTYFWSSTKIEPYYDFVSNRDHWYDYYYGYRYLNDQSMVWQLDCNDQIINLYNVKYGTRLDDLLQNYKKNVDLLKQKEVSGPLKAISAGTFGAVTILSVSSAGIGTLIAIGVLLTLGLGAESINIALDIFDLSRETKEICTDIIKIKQK